jgi:hypothetical protein
MSSKHAWNLRTSKKVHSFGVPSIVEIVLLGIGVAEDVIAEQVYEDDSRGPSSTGWKMR